MRDLLNRILRAPEGGGGAAGGDGGAGAGGEGAGGAAAAGAGTEGGAGAGAGAGGTAALGYRPEGLADEFYGATDQETIDKLFAAQNAAREGIPEDVKEYGKFENVDDALKPYFETIENDGMFDDIAAVAKENGMSKAGFQALVGKFMEKSSELGLLEPPLDKTAERNALLPEAARNLPKSAQDQAIDRRMSDNVGFVGSMVSRGLDQDVADHMVMMLGDSAKGHRAIEFFRAQMSGEGNARPSGAGSGGGKGDPRAELAARAALPENTPGDPKFNRQSWEALDADYKRLSGA